MISDEARRWIPLVLLGSAALAGCADPAWSSTGSMIAARSFHSATTLGNGSVLFAGGEGAEGALRSAELYSLQRDAWSPASPMTAARRDHTATLLFDPDSEGQVLIAGGRNLEGSLRTTELYEPHQDVWLSAKPMSEARVDHTATLLPGGVLIVGGDSGSALPGVELYDVAAGTWSKVAFMAEPRRLHTATLLLDGKVLIAGGDDGKAALRSATLYDPAADKMAPWSAAGPLKGARKGHTATLLPNGKVLIAGGDDEAALSSAELYDPTADTWSEAASMAEARRGHTATLLENGKVLVAGGEGAGGALRSAELYDSATNAWADAGPLVEVRKGHTATRLADGEVLIAGGDEGSARRKAELYQPDSQCRTLADCPTSLVCNEQKQCVSPTAAALEGGCAAAGGQLPEGFDALSLGAIALLAALGRRRGWGRDLQVNKELPR